MARITLLGPAWPYRGGIAHFSAAVARTLAARGHEVQSVTFRRQYPERLFPGKSQFDEGPPPADVPIAWQLLDTLNPLSWRQTARFIADGGAEVAVLMYWMPFLAPALGTVARVLRRRGVTVLAVIHNALPHERRPGDIALGRYALRSCDGLVVMSEKVRADLDRIGVAAPIYTVAHPVYDGFGDPVDLVEARATLGLPHDAPVFLFFGFIRRYKGLHILLDAWRRVHQRLPRAHLLIAGEFYADEDSLRAQAASLGETVHLHADYIPDDQVALYFSAADAVVQPYLTATQSGVAQIAFHFGRPVITTDVGGLAEVVPNGEAGLVVPPDDAPALAGALVRFVEEGLSDRLAVGVRQQREHYSWDRLAEAIEGLTGQS